MASCDRLVPASAICCAPRMAAVDTAAKAAQTTSIRTYSLPLIVNSLPLNIGRMALPTDAMPYHGAWTSGSDAAERLRRGDQLGDRRVRLSHGDQDQRLHDVLATLELGHIGRQRDL